MYHEERELAFIRHAMAFIVSVVASVGVFVLLCMSGRPTHSDAAPKAPPVLAVDPPGDSEQDTDDGRGPEVLIERCDRCIVNVYGGVANVGEIN